MKTSMEAAETSWNIARTLTPRIEILDLLQEVLGFLGYIL